MKNFVLLLFLGLLPLFLFAQQKNSSCELVYLKADSLFKSADYQLAIKKLTAYKVCCNLNQQKKADSLLLRIYETVNKQRIDAIEAKKKAEQSEKEAIQERDKAQANYLISEAKSIVENDPTLALRLAEEAMKKSKDNSIIKTALKIYKENSFYQMPFADLGYYSANFSKDGSLIFLGGKYGLSYLIRFTNNQFLPYLHEDYSIIKSSISYDNKYILTLDMTTSLSGNLLYSMKCRNNEDSIIQNYKFKKDINDFIFSPVNHTFLICTNDSTFRLFDLEGNVIQEFKGHSGKVTSLAFSPDGKYIVSGSADWTARLWSLDGICLHVYKKNTSYISSIAISPDGKSILTGAWDNTAKLIDTSGYIIQDFKGHSDFITSVSFSHNGNFVLTGSLDNTARLWNLQGVLLQEFKGHLDRIESVAFYPNDKSILTTSKDKTVRSWVIKNQSIISDDENEIIHSFQVSYKNNLIFTTSLDSIGRLRNSNGDVINRFIGHKGYVTTCDISLNEKFIITGSYDSTAILWNIDGSIKRIFSGYNNRINEVRFSLKEDKILLYKMLSDSIEVWDINENLSERYFGIPPACFSPDGRYLITTNPSNFTDENYFIHDLETKNFHQYNHPQPVNEIIYFPDGKSILTSFTDTIRVINLNGKVTHRFYYKNYGFYSLDISPEGKYILAIGNNKDGETMIILNLSGDVIYEYFLGNHFESIAKFSSNGKDILIKIDGNNELIKLKIPENVIDFLKNGEIEPLSKEQKMKYNIK